MGLDVDGTVVAVGCNSDGQCNVTGWMLKCTFSTAPLPLRVEVRLYCVGIQAVN